MYKRSPPLRYASALTAILRRISSRISYAFAISGLTVVALGIILAVIYFGRVADGASDSVAISTTVGPIEAGRLLMDTETIRRMGAAAPFDITSIVHIRLIPVPFLHGISGRFDVFGLAKWALCDNNAINATYSSPEPGLIDVAVPFEGWWGALLFDSNGHRACSRIAFIPSRGAEFCEEINVVQSLAFVADPTLSRHSELIGAAEVVRIIARPDRFMLESVSYSSKTIGSDSRLLWCDDWGLADVYWYGGAGCMGVASATIDSVRGEIRLGTLLEVPVDQIVDANIADDDLPPVLIDQHDPFVFHIFDGRHGASTYVPLWGDRSMVWLTCYQPIRPGRTIVIDRISIRVRMVDPLEEGRIVVPQSVRATTSEIVIDDVEGIGAGCIQLRALGTDAQARMDRSTRSLVIKTAWSYGDDAIAVVTGASDCLVSCDATNSSSIDRPHDASVVSEFKCHIRVLPASMRQLRIVDIFGSKLSGSMRYSFADAALELDKYKYRSLQRTWTTDANGLFVRRGITFLMVPIGATLDFELANDGRRWTGQLSRELQEAVIMR